MWGSIDGSARAVSLRPLCVDTHQDGRRITATDKYKFLLDSERETWAHWSFLKLVWKTYMKYIIKDMRLISLNKRGW
jgi:hypothetical protein